MSTGAAVAAAARRIERRLVEYLRESGAITPISASTIPDQRWMGKRILQRLIASGAVRKAKSGYYLDESAYEAYRARRRRNAMIVIGTVAVVALVVIWWASQR